MMRVLRVLRKVLLPLPLTMLLCFMLAAMVYFRGERLGAGGIYPLAYQPWRGWAVFLLLLAGLVLLVTVATRAVLAWRARQATREARPPTQEEIETRAMAQVFARISEVIRARWSGEGNALYGLPWYLVLGAKGAGKTAMIENSDLRFPVDHEIRTALADLQETEAGSFARWRIDGNQAVLIEPDGAAFIRHEDRTPMQDLLWRGFLDGLLRLRPRRPLNGLVLVVDLVDFAEMTSIAREAFGQQVRRIVSDVIEGIGTRITIHVVFTKLDQIAGFVDFFENLGPAEREELFGFHFCPEESDGAA